MEPGVRRLGAQRVGLAVELLRQEIEPASHRFELDWSRQARRLDMTP